MMPLLRFIRMCDSDGQHLGLVYSRVEAVRKHFQNEDAVPSMEGVCSEVLVLFEQESKDWVNDMHKTMHILAILRLLE